MFWRGASDTHLRPGLGAIGSDSTPRRPSAVPAGADCAIRRPWGLRAGPQENPNRLPRFQEPLAHGGIQAGFPPKNRTFRPCRSPLTIGKSPSRTNGGQKTSCRTQPTFRMTWQSNPLVNPRKAMTTMANRRKRTAKNLTLAILLTLSSPQKRLPDECAGLADTGTVVFGHLLDHLFFVHRASDFDSLGSIHDLCPYKCWVVI